MTDRTSRAIGFGAFGGPEVLRPLDLPLPPLAPGEIRIRHTAIGVNFTDIHARRGDYREFHELPKPIVPGIEAVGVVVESNDTRFAPGDRAAYASRPLGAYCDVRNFPAARCVMMPAGLADETVAACFLKGLTVHVFTRRVFDLRAGMYTVFHSAAGGVGTLAGQWLAARGVHAIGIVGSEEKVEIARRAGYEAVFVRGRDDWPARVRELSGGGVPAVYDAVGQATFEGSIACLAPRGHLVCFGNSSGIVPPISINMLRDRGSLSLTWARFGDYVSSAAELQASASELFEALQRGELHPAVQTLPLSQAAEAHRLLEAQRTTGSLVLLPQMD